MRRALLFFCIACLAGAQQPDISGSVRRQIQIPVIAIPDFRGSGEAQKLMPAFNSALADDLQNSGALKIAPKTFYPLNTPQRPEEFRRADWFSPPVSANYVAFGYAAAKDGGLVLFAWLNTTAEAPNANLFGKLYFGSLDEAGAKKVASEFATDILEQFGVKSLEGTKIYFVSDRSRSKEIWRMNYDGSNQERVTDLKTITQMPAVSADGTMLAYMSLAKRRGESVPVYQIFIASTETGRKLPFDDPPAPTTGWPEFLPDGQHLLFASSLTGYTQIYMSNLDGSARRQISFSKALDISPKVNPKNGRDVLFISDRSGKQQLWHMNLDGGDVEMLTNGIGEVANPAWSPDGRMIAFAWTQGFEIGAFNIFVMDIAERRPIQLTKDSGVNENPWWAPDGLHIVYSSRRGDSTQIFTMLADGTNVQQLTRQGNNYQPVWANSLPQ
jgi:TolB protein